MWSYELIIDKIIEIIVLEEQKHLSVPMLNGCLQSHKDTSLCEVLLIRFFRLFSSIQRGKFHTNFTPASRRLHPRSINLPQQAGRQNPQTKEGIVMTFSGLEWYWWLVIVAVLAVAVPCKIKFVKWWSRREQEKKQEQRGKWGDDA